MFDPDKAVDDSSFGADNDADEDALNGYSPEQLKQLIGLGTFGQRGDELQRRLAQAQAMSQPTPVGGHVNPLAALLDGLGGSVRNIAGAHQQQALQGQYSKLLGDTDTQRAAYAQAVLKALARPPRRPQLPGDDQLEAGMRNTAGDGREVVDSAGMGDWMPNMGLMTG